MRERKGPKRKETINKRKEYRFTESKRKIKATQEKWISCLFSTGAELELSHHHRHLGNVRQKERK